MNWLFSRVSRCFVLLAVGLIVVYQKSLSPMKAALLGPHAGCRYSPTCSQYSREAFLKHGFLKGLYLTISRILRCNPFFCGGHDPVPAVFSLTRPADKKCCGRSKIS